VTGTAETITTLDLTLATGRRHCNAPPADGESPQRSVCSVAVVVLHVRQQPESEVRGGTWVHEPKSGGENYGENLQALHAKHPRGQLSD
jgi:hypothetical protein